MTVEEWLTTGDAGTMFDFLWHLIGWRNLIHDPAGTVAVQATLVSSRVDAACQRQGCTVPEVAREAPSSMSGWVWR